MKIVYYEEDDILFIELAKGEIVREESASWNVNIGYTAYRHKLQFSNVDS